MHGRHANSIFHGIQATMHHHPYVVSTTVLFDYAAIVSLASSYLLLLHNHEGYFTILCNNTSTKVHIGGGAQVYVSA